MKTSNLFEITIFIGINLKICLLLPFYLLLALGLIVVSLTSLKLWRLLLCNEHGISAKLAFSGNCATILYIKSINARRNFRSKIR